MPVEPNALPSPDIIPLQGDAGAFARRSFPAFREQLSPLGSDSVAIGARAGALAGARPVGLILAQRHPGGAVLLSVSVDPVWRRRGVGARLVEALVAALPDGDTLSATYSSRLPERAAFEALLRRTGWDAPELQAMRAAGTPRAVLDWAESHAPALRVLRGYTLALWKDATAQDHAEVRRLIAEGDIDADFSPFAMMEQFQHWPDNSWLVRRDGVTVGWMFARLQPPATVWYHGAAMRRSLEQTGPLLMLFHRVHQVAQEALGPDSVWRIDSFPRTPAMLGFLRRRVAAFASFLDELHRVRRPGAPSVHRPDPIDPGGPRVS